MSHSTKVFVHGVPETSAVWSPLVDELSTRGVTNIVLLSPPGFGTPSPAGWGASMYDYRDWLLNELDNIDGPIDLVAHDWGAGYLYNALATQPHIVRSWATDVTECCTPTTSGTTQLRLGKLPTLVNRWLPAWLQCPIKTSPVSLPLQA